MRSGWKLAFVAPRAGLYAASALALFVGGISTVAPLPAARAQGTAAPGETAADPSAANPGVKLFDLRDIDIVPAMLKDKLPDTHPFDHVELHRLCPTLGAGGDFLKAQSGPPLHPLATAKSGKGRSIDGEPATQVASLWRSQLFFPHLDEALCHTPVYGLKFSYKGDTTLQASISYVCRNVVLIDKAGKSLGIVSFDTLSTHSKLLRQKFESLLDDKAAPQGECIGEEPLAATMQRLREPVEKDLLKAGKKPAELKVKPGQPDPVLQALSTALGIKGSVLAPQPPPPPAPGTAPAPGPGKVAAPAAPAGQPPKK